jgi:folylpolyglutamate synthase/dihydropteroate synthase
MAKLFNLTTDQIINYNENIIPTEIVIEDKSTLEQMELIQQLDEEDKSTVFKIIDKMNLQLFLRQNLYTLYATFLD